jgi:hypothetical protein
MCVCVRVRVYVGMFNISQKFKSECQNISFQLCTAAVGRALIDTINNIQYNIILY